MREFTGDDKAFIEACRAIVDAAGIDTPHGRIYSDNAMQIRANFNGCRLEVSIRPRVLGPDVSPVVYLEPSDGRDPELTPQARLLYPHTWYVYRVYVEAPDTLD